MIINFPLLGSGGGTGKGLAPVDEFPQNPEEGQVVAYAGSASATGVYQYDGADWVPVGVDDLSDYYTSAQTETAIDNKLGDYLSKVEYEPKELAISAALNQLNSDVQTISGNTPDMSLYTPTTGFSTINGSAITEGTNIIIEGGGSGTELLPVSAFPQSAEIGTLVAKTDIEPTIGYWETSDSALTFHLIDTAYTGTAITLATLLNNATNPMLDGDIDISLEYNYDDSDLLQVILKVGGDDSTAQAFPFNMGEISQDWVYDEIQDDPAAIAPGDYYYISYNFTCNGDALTFTVKKTYDGTEGFVSLDFTSEDYELANLPGTTVVDGIYQYDGTEWNKYEGGSASGSNIVELTQAQYDALTTKDPDTLYIISDASSINMDNYALQTDLTTLSNTVNTSLSTKADAANITANNSNIKFPKWNSQGIITGSVDGNTYYNYGFYINGNSRVIPSTGSFPNIFAPTTAGDAGKPLVSNGSGAPVWGAYKFAFLTETEYDALTTKETDTIYFVVPDPE